MDNHEREILTDFIELYCNLPCLWDIGSEVYKDKNQKAEGWQLLVEILNKIDPAADVALAKKKIEHMRTAYRREEKKIKESKKTGAEGGDIHVPNLWYFKLLSPVFNRLDELIRSGVYTPKSIKNEGSRVRRKARKKRHESLNEPELEVKKHKVVETVQHIDAYQQYRTVHQQTRNRNTSSFGVYVGEQLEQVETFQRQVAEKLISEVLFLARTGNLHFDTKIEPPPGAHGLIKLSNNISYSQSPSPQYILSPASPQYSYTVSSAQHMPPSSPKAEPLSLLSEEDKKNTELSIPKSDTSLHPVPTEVDHTYTAIIHEGPASALKELLLIKNKKK